MRAPTCLRLASAGRLADGARARRWVRRTGFGLILLAAFAGGFYLSPLGRFCVPEGRSLECSVLPVLAQPGLWIGLAPGVDGAALFFQASGLKGPIFNGYDIGGYLIGTLFPRERPFVDNRPEAYPGEFFRQVYIPMQEDEALWDEVCRRYRFETIIFFRHDQTPRTRGFLGRRSADPGWALVYKDLYTVIFARRGGVNQPVIDRVLQARERSEGEAS